MVDRQCAVGARRDGPRGRSLVARLSDPDDRGRAPRVVAVPAALPSARRAFAAILATITAGLLGTATAWGAPVFGAGLVALSLWLGKQDIARRTIRNRGLTRFIAACLLSGYAWLAVGGAIIVAAGGLAPGSPSYDAALHALTLGFVFAMVFGHAPIIFPAVLRVAVPYHPTFYLPLALLHLSLVVRLAGDATGAVRLDAPRGHAERARARCVHRRHGKRRGARHAPSAGAAIAIAGKAAWRAAAATSRSTPRGIRSCRARR